MRIGIWHHAVVPVKKYGGTERLVTWLSDTLAGMGHEPVLLVPPGSTSATSRVVHLPPEVFEGAEQDPRFPLDEHLPPDLDVLHRFSEIACQTSVPDLVTIGGNGEPGTYGPRAVFVSRNHMERMRGRHFVHNGLPPGAYDYREQKDDYVLFLSKARWKVKGVDRAERIARRAGVKLIIAGGWRLNLTRKIKSMGMVGGWKKKGLLAGARALLFPIRWEEPFGLVVVEALASGTPVLASRRGSMPELVSEDVGVLCETEDAFVEALRRVDRFDPAACRRRAEERFSARRMAEGYLELYGRLLAGGVEPGGRGPSPGGEA